METTEQTLEWFKDQEMSEVACILPDGQTEKLVSIMSEKDAKHYFEMQNRGYTFKKKVIIHRAVDGTCHGCEG